MYTSTIIGSYNTIANSDHHGGVMVMKPPIKKQPRKSGSKDLPSVPQAQRSTSEDSSNFVSINLPPDAPPFLSGLQVLSTVDSVDINPDKTYAPEIRSVGFTIDGPDGRILFKCLPSESSATRLLVFQTMDGVHVLHVKTETPYCCSWFKTIEAKLTLPSGGQFATIVKTAHGFCKCDRKFSLTCYLSESEKVQFDVEVLVSSSEFLVKQSNEEIVAKVTARRLGHRRLYKVSFTKPELSPNVKAMFIVFAMILHIAFAEKLNTCLGMCLCCLAGVCCPTWVAWFA